MKKLIFLAIVMVSMTIAPAFSQAQEDSIAKNPFVSSVNDKNVLFVLSGGWYGWEGWGFGATIHFRHIQGMGTFRNVYFGLVATKKANLGLEAGFRRNLIDNGNFRVHQIIGLGWQYRCQLFMQHDSLISRTVGDQNKMITAFRLGLGMEIARVGVFANFNPGISWNPTSNFNWGTNGYYYWGGEIGLSFLF